MALIPRIISPDYPLYLVQRGNNRRPMFCRRGSPHLSGNALMAAREHG